ncbi:MAG: hypothetical protein NXI16_01475 [Alphaproteobacteria bacterium]|nr:hypothetical protein [Alphaproteobacteria bacterium]
MTDTHYRCPKCGSNRIAHRVVQEGHWLLNEEASEIDGEIVPDANNMTLCLDCGHEDRDETAFKSELTKDEAVAQERKELIEQLDGFGRYIIVDAKFAQEAARVHVAKETGDIDSLFEEAMDALREKYDKNDASWIIENLAAEDIEVIRDFVALAAESDRDEGDAEALAVEHLREKNLIGKEGAA